MREKLKDGLVVICFKGKDQTWELSKGVETADRREKTLSSDEGGTGKEGTGVGE